MKLGQSPRRDRSTKFVALASVAALLLALAAFWFWGVPNSRKIDIDEKSVAVLPFDNLSADKANAYFASGMQDEIVTKLAQLPNVKIVSRSSTARYQQGPRDLRVIARELNVTTVLQGSVQRAGDDLLINVQLIEPASDNHLWAESYRRKFDNIFDVEAEVARNVADALHVKIAAARKDRLLVVPTTNPRAHDLFLRGHAWARTRMSKALSARSRFCRKRSRRIRITPWPGEIWPERLSYDRRRLSRAARCPGADATRRAHVRAKR